MTPRKRDAAAAELPVAWNAVVDDLMDRVDNVRRAFLQAERARLHNIDNELLGDATGGIRHSPLPETSDQLCISCATPSPQPHPADSVRWQRLGVARFACWRCFDRLGL